MIANKQLVGHRVACIMVSLDIYVRRRHNTVRQFLSNEINSIDYIKSKDNLVDPLTKGLMREQVNCTSRGMGLKPMKK